uniref:GPN-loop GTPase n=1 Tax=Romanomermis culicivorax TaxID=13658 RepID=A0A915K8A8_ROMCU
MPILRSFAMEIDNEDNPTTSATIHQELKIPHIFMSDKLPVSIIVLGMAGSGKTTFVQRLTAHLYNKSETPYVINLDPAVCRVPYPANIDIRDTVNYKEVMKQYNLGPNGAILTALNLFTTRFDQALNLLTKRQKEFKYFIFDTPGQIEVFTWSASGTIITETLASAFPTVIVYVMDVVRSVNPTTFMSNMLYACSILYKMKLPFIIALNKSDIIDPKFAKAWMKDFELFHKSLEDDHSFMNDLTRSLSLVLDEFYTNIKAVAVSAATGDGMDEFFDSIGKCVEEYEKVCSTDPHDFLRQKFYRVISKYLRTEVPKMAKKTCLSRLHHPASIRKMMKEMRKMERYHKNDNGDDFSKQLYFTGPTEKNILLDHW